MDVKRFETIKEQIRSLELESASSKGKMETIEQSWENKYGFKTLNEAENKCSEIKKEIQDKETSKNMLMDKLEKSFDWDKI